MRVCIIGCGAIGSLFGAHLAKLEDVEVWAYDLSKEHVDAINENGLRLTGESDFVAPVNARSDASEIPECEFGMVCEQACPPGAIRRQNIDFKECVRCDICYVKLIKQAGTCRHDMAHVIASTNNAFLGENGVGSA